MLVDDNEYESLIAARLLDFFAPTTRWQRCLWAAGTILCLQEILEASEATKNGVLSRPALEFLVDQARRLLGHDPGIGDTELRSSLQQALAGDMTHRGYGYTSLEQLVPAIHSGYLARLATAISSKNNSPAIERAARAIASHLLDSGYSAIYLHRWWSYRLKHSQRAVRLPEILREAAEQLVPRGSRSYEIIVPFGAFPADVAGAELWIDPAELARLLKSRRLDVSDIRHHGGMRLHVDALDPWGAVDRASERVDILLARMAIGKRGTAAAPLGIAWVEGETERYQLRSPRRVEVRALERENRLFDLKMDGIVDAALHLLSPLNQGPAGSAVAGGWAAVESVLCMPGDRERVQAAERLAHLVACSWPRAELTALSHRYQQENDDALATRLRSAGENRAKARLVLEAIVAGETLRFARPSDQAAFKRMKEVALAPKIKLGDVQGHVAAAICRLYRQRNLVLHGGQVQSVALRTALRTAAPLVGAGFDRIAHAWFVDGTPPDELAVRAGLSIAHLKESAGLQLVDLLEKR